MHSYIQPMLVLGLLGIAVSALAAPAGKITKASFGKTTDTLPQAVDLYTLTNANGAEARISNYGGIIVSLTMPDKNGKMADVVLGYDKLEDYLKATPYFGALIGRYGNRIGDGKFTLEGKEYTLAKNNNGVAHLHGGKVGFDKKVWTATPKMTKSGPTLTLTYLSQDGEEGYPGNLKVKVVYTLTRKNELKIAFTATTDKPTVVNLTNHSYFNLAGAGTGDVLKHQVTINSAKITPVDKNLIPTGKFMEVKGTPFDFTTPHAIGERITADDEQLKLGGGYDHCFVVNQKTPDKLTLQARVVEPASGRVLECLSTEPAVQFYSGNFLDGSNIGKGGKPYQKRYAFCLEPEHFPDSPNKPQFPSTELKPGETYKHTMIYRFSVRK